MKNFTLTIAIVLIQLLLFAQCPQGDIYFNTQDQIDNFQINYPNCSEIEGSVTISGSDITNLNGLSVLTSIGGDLYIQNNAALTSLYGLQGLTSIGGGLYINGTFGNPVLTSLAGLDNITSIGGDLEISGCDVLTSLTGLDNLTSIMGGLLIGVPVLTNLAGLDNVAFVGGGLTISSCDILSSLTGLGNVTSIGGSLSIQNCDNLTSLTGLENLTSIYGGLEINSCNALTTLTGLDNIDAGSIYYLHIRYNQLLSTCEVQSVCNYLVALNGDIFENAPGCNSQEEVEEACEWVSIKENINFKDILIYPNPSSSTITIELPTQPSNNTTLTISNINGQQLITQAITEPQTEIDFSHLPVGIYVVKVWNDSEVMVRKVIKQ